MRPALVTGFEPYGGRGRNPAGEVAARLDGSEVAGVRVVSRNLPVAFAAARRGRLRQRSPRSTRRS